MRSSKVEIDNNFLIKVSYNENYIFPPDSWLAAGIYKADNINS